MSGYEHQDPEPAGSSGKSSGYRPGLIDGCLEVLGILLFIGLVYSNIHRIYDTGMGKGDWIWLASLGLILIALAFGLVALVKYGIEALKKRL